MNETKSLVYFFNLWRLRGVQFPLDGDGRALLHGGCQRFLKLGERQTQQRLQITHKAIHIALVGDFLDDILVIVVAEATAQLLVVHSGLALAVAPAACNLRRVSNLELPVGLVGPFDAGLALAVREQFQ